MQEFLTRLSNREKTIVVVSALLLAGLGLHALVIEPYQEKQEKKCRLPGCPEAFTHLFLAPGWHRRQRDYRSN